MGAAAGSSVEPQHGGHRVRVHAPMRLLPMSSTSSPTLVWKARQRSSWPRLARSRGSPHPAGAEKFLIRDLRRPSKERGGLQQQFEGPLASVATSPEAPEVLAPATAAGRRQCSVVVPDDGEKTQSSLPTIPPFRGAETWSARGRSKMRHSAS